MLDAGNSQRSPPTMCAALLENKLVAGQDSEEHASIDSFSARVSSRIPSCAKGKDGKDGKDEKGEQDGLMLDARCSRCLEP